MTRRLPKVTMRQINPSGTREPITLGGLFMMMLVVTIRMMMVMRRRIRMRIKMLMIKMIIMV